MTAHYSEVAFTLAVKAEQHRHGSRRGYAAREAPQPLPRDVLGPEEAAFIMAQDSLYMASVSETGWPYMQHRGGPQGFVRVLSEGRIGFADFRGNRQYISLGNLSRDSRVSLFFMDYARRARLKILGYAEAVDLSENARLAAELALPDYKANVERALIIDIEAFDWNCPQHITPRYTENQVLEAVTSLKARIAELEAELNSRA